MNALNIIGVVGGLASIVGLVYAFYHAKKLVRIKRIIYEASESIPIAMATKTKKHRFTLLYGTEDKREEIESAYLTYLRFANFGKEPIRRGDFVSRNPVRIVIKGCRILDIGIATVRREVTGIEIRNTSNIEDEASSELTWEFLDHKDGARIGILTDGKPRHVKLSGDIVGMPQGIQNFAEIRPSRRDRRVVYGTSITLLVSAAILNGYIFKWTTGAWSHVWLLVIPILTLFAVLSGIILVTALLYPSSKRFWGSELSFLPRFVPRLIAAFFSSASECVATDAGESKVVEK